MFNHDSTLGEIVATFPKAGSIFKAHKIDYCCGGDRTLAEATAADDATSGALLEEINTEYNSYLKEAQKEVDWTTAPLSDLVTYVVNTHHAYLQKTLPILGELTTKILRVHGPNHADTLGPLHRNFHLFKMDLEQHMIKEEASLFPLVIEFEKTGDVDVLARLLSNIDELEAEHTEAGDLLKTMRAITNDYDVPADACGTYSYTFQKLAEVEEDMFRHVHLENNVMFPRLQAIGEHELVSRSLI